MRIIVTGGAGFIASHIVDAYIAKGHHVAVIDNLSTGFRRNLNPRARFYKEDILNQRLLEQIFQKEKPEVINHHAALASVIASIANPNATFEANVLGTVNLLRAFGAHGKGKNRKIIFASTGGAIYGTPKKLPASEATLPMPSSPYGLSKLLAEEAVAFYSRNSRFTHTIFRYANVYGPRQNPKGEAGVVSIFAALMKQGKQLTIFGDGSKTRDYVYVADIARANVAALTKGNGKTINLGTGIMTSDKEVFDAVAQALRFRGTPQYAPFRSGEVNKISLDARHAKRILGWTPHMRFREGVACTVHDV